jgi:hypothetical protein
METPTQSSAEHLLVLVHGLWGNPNHLNHLRDTLQAQQSDERLHIFLPKSNADSFTYDGIEVGGERITNEIEHKIKELEQIGAKIKKISLTGYSLGGLVSRYAIGLMYKNGLFDDIEPVNFTTFATPHLGIKTPKKGYRSVLWDFMGSRTLSVSGQQMFLIDKFRDSGRPLLSVMADESSIFMKGLNLFKNKWLYANTTNDRSVPFFTASINSSDPFVDLDKIDVHYLPDQDDPVVLDPVHPVSLRKASKQEGLSRSERFSLISQQTRTALPFYALFFSLFPLVLPAFLVNSVIQTYKSTQRVQLHEKGLAGINLGRYRIPLLEEAQAAQDRALQRMASQTEEEFLPTPPPEQESPSTSTSSLGSHEYERKRLRRRRSSRSKNSPFPTLALSDEQFEMMENLNGVGFTKYPVHIQRHRHTHAAIVVRIEKEGFDEGRVVVRHWAERFEV